VFGSQKGASDRDIRLLDAALAQFALVLERHLPCLVLAGRVSVDQQAAADAGVTRAYSLSDEMGGPDEAVANAPAGLRQLSARVARLSWR
jgi:glycerate 2-kinase